MGNKIPTNIITGILGVGKTTAIGHLLQQVPQDQRWAVLVNEYGQVGLDGLTIAQQDPKLPQVAPAGPVIRELVGGCLCCTLGVPVQVALTELVRRVRPDRLLIEPTGVGHPAGLLDTLREGPLAGSLEVRATICLVNPQQYFHDRYASSEIFQDQIQLADVLVATKTDLAGPMLTQRFLQAAAELFPPKSFVTAVRHSQLLSDWLDLPTTPGRVPLFPDAHRHGRTTVVIAHRGQQTHWEHTHHGPHSGHHDHQNHDHDHDAEGDWLPPSIPDPQVGAPVRVQTTGFGEQACGWVFAAQEVFNRQKLFGHLRQATGISRLKGVFHLGGRWVLVNRVGDSFDSRPFAYRRDSRLEVFAMASDQDWDLFEQQLLDCLCLSPEEE